MEKPTITSRRAGSEVESSYEGPTTHYGSDDVEKIKKYHETIIHSTNISKLITIVEEEI